MASTLEARRLTEAHRLAQARIGAETVRGVLAAFPLLDGTDLDGTFDRWLRVVLPVIQAQRSTSARLAANYLTTYRALELGVSGDRLAPVLAESLPVEAVTTSMLVTGPAYIKSNIGRGMALRTAMQTAQATTSRSAMRHALNGGRETIARSDRKATGYRRVLSGDPCDYCQSLAIEAESDPRAAFVSHDGCSCSAEPVYD